MVARIFMLAILDIAAKVSDACVNTKPNCYDLPDRWCEVGTNVEAQCALRCGFCTVGTSDPTSTTVTMTSMLSSTLTTSSDRSATAILTTRSFNHSTSPRHITTSDMQSSGTVVATNGLTSTTPFIKQAPLSDYLTTTASSMSATLSTFKTTTNNNGTGTSDLFAIVTETDNLDNEADLHNSTSSNMASASRVILIGGMVSIVMCAI